MYTKAPCKRRSLYLPQDPLPRTLQSDMQVITSPRPSPRQHLNHRPANRLRAANDRNMTTS
jgi:hypothetical protein